MALADNPRNDPFRHKPEEEWTSEDVADWVEAVYPPREDIKRALAQMLLRQRTTVLDAVEKALLAPTGGNCRRRFMNVQAAIKELRGQHV